MGTQSERSVDAWDCQAKIILLKPLQFAAPSLVGRAKFGVNHPNRKK